MRPSGVPKVVTIFGGSGFVGRHVVRRLARLGCVVRVAVRRPSRAQFLKPMGDVGQIAPIRCDVTDDADVAEAVAGADAVINLVGILYEKGKIGFQAVHADAADRVARAAAKAGVARYVHMSALGAEEGAAAKYAASKAEGEARVRAAFPSAMIVRPSVVFGPQDGFFNLFAGLARFSPVLPLIGGGHTRFQPVYVGDVAEAIVKGLTEKATAGKTFELGGPRVYTFKELMRLLLAQIKRRRLLLPIPWPLAEAQAAVLQLLPKPLLTPDQVTLLRKDNVCSGAFPGLKELGIEPTAAEVILPSYMDMYRPGGRFVGPGTVVA